MTEIGFTVALDIQDKSPQQLGLDLDALEKQRLAPMFGIEIGDQYAKWDFRIIVAEENYFDFKLACASSITMSEQELDFAKDQIARGNNYFIIEYRLDRQMQLARCQGALDIKLLIDNNKIQKSQFPPTKIGQLPTVYYKLLDIPKSWYM